MEHPISPTQSCSVFVTIFLNSWQYFCIHSISAPITIFLNSWQYFCKDCRQYFFNDYRQFFLYLWQYFCHKNWFAWSFVTFLDFRHRSSSIFTYFILWTQSLLINTVRMYAVASLSRPLRIVTVRIEPWTLRSKWLGLTPVLTRPLTLKDL